MKPARGKDLVSSTLDRYIKHRFNGELLPHQTRHDDSDRLSSSDTTNNLKNPSRDTNCTNSTNGTVNSNNHTQRFYSGQARASFIELDDDSIDEEHLAQSARKLLLENIKQIDDRNLNNSKVQPPSICCFASTNTRPCSTAVRDDLRFMAMGFENSLIYIWNLRGSKASFKLDKMHIRRDISTFDLSKANQLVTQESKSTTYVPSSSNTNTNINDGKETQSTGKKPSDAIPWFRKTLFAHSGPVYGLFFVPESELLLSCSEDTTIRLWCLKSFCNIAIYRGHAYPIWALDVASHGGHFLSGSMDTTARLWTFEKNSPIRIFCGHDSSVECVRFHPNGKYIATGSSDSTVRLWSVTDGNMVRLMVGHSKPVSCLSFLPDGKYLASSSLDSSIKIWDLSKNSVVRELSCQPNSNPIYSISFSHDQIFLSSCGADCIIRIWRVDDIASDTNNIDDINSSSNPSANNHSNSTESHTTDSGSHYLEPKGKEIIDLSSKFTNLLHSQFLDKNILLVFGSSTDSE